MKKSNIVLILALIIIFLNLNTFSAYATEGEKSILIALDQLDFQDIEELFPEEDVGIGFMNLKTRKPYGDESFYFSIGLGRKVGTRSENYKGLHQNSNDSIDILGFEDLLEDLKNRNNNVRMETLGEKLKTQGISYIGDGSSAIIAADKDGRIKTGEVNIEYEENWLEGKTKEHLSNSSTLVLSYEVDENEERIELLKDYVDSFKDYNILIVAKAVSQDMNYILNNNLSPIIYSNGKDSGLIESVSTKRSGIITSEDIYEELLAINGVESNISIGNRIEIVEKENNFNESKYIFKKNINLLWLSYLFHGIVYFLQVLFAYYLYKDKRDKFSKINIFNHFIIINIFISLVMGASNFHINIVLYLFLNILITYLITEITWDKGVNIIGLFSTLTYGIIVFGIVFHPDLIYNSYIGFNNLFYGARYYGFNNGVMGVLLVTSIISYFFVKDLMPNKIADNLVCLGYFLINIIVLSAHFGANTGGFLTSVALFLIIVYTNLLDKKWNVKNTIILILIGILIFGVNMYFDNISNEQSHAINFLSRIKEFGINEFIDMFLVKAKALIKLTLLPPFIIVIVAQIFSLKNLFKDKKIALKKKYYIILFIAILGFLINDTGMIFFIYVIHYLIATLLYKDIKTLL